MRLAAGTRIGNYEVLTPLGAGGMGEVYRARDTRLDRDVALKSLPEAFSRDPERLGRFEREAKLLASLNHPNIAAIYGLEDVDGSPHLVLELIEGETLAQRLARGPLTVGETLQTGQQIASAIDAAHERGIVHRDLKPGNVMLTPPGAVKVLDFGLGKGTPITDSSSSFAPTAAPETGAGVLLGTAPYMSPEQARGKEVDRRTDVWALGCILFECLTGRRPFAGETTSDSIARILEREPEWSELPAGLPPRLADLVRRCLTKDVSQRPRDIGDVGRELAALTQDRSSVSSVSSARAALPSLAVLYFENLSSDKESEYFCSGITEDILTDLSKIQGLRVASRNAVARFKGTAPDIPTVGRELGVSAVLEGSVRKAGDRVRITAQLINVADGFHLWAERFDRTLQDVFDVQEEIASSIAQALRVALTPSETRELVQNRPDDPRAYDLYLKGRARYGSYSPESLREALSLFQKAIEIDPEYALAWAGVADCYGQLCQWSATGDTEAWTRQGLEAARKAIALNPKLPEGYKSEALILHMAGDIDGTRASLAKALEANPRFTPALINLAVVRFTQADLAGAERMIQRTIEIDPQEAFAVSWLAFIQKMTDRDDAVLAGADRLRQLSKDPFYVFAAHLWRVWVHLGRGDAAAVQRAIPAALADGVSPGFLEGSQAMIAARERRTDEARSALQRAESSGLGGLDAIISAGAAILIGDVEHAIRFMSRRAVRDFSPVVVRLVPWLHPLAERAPFAPRRLDVALVWPLEAPMIDAARHKLFREVRVESGIPEGSDVLER